MCWTCNVIGQDASLWDRGGSDCFVLFCLFWLSFRDGETGERKRRRKKDKNDIRHTRANTGKEGTLELHFLFGCLAFFVSFFFFSFVTRRVKRERRRFGTGNIRNIYIALFCCFYFFVVLTPPPPSGHYFLFFTLTIYPFVFTSLLRQGATGKHQKRTKIYKSYIKKNRTKLQSQIDKNWNGRWQI